MWSFASAVAVCGAPVASDPPIMPGRLDGGCVPRWWRPWGHGRFLPVPRTPPASGHTGRRCRGGQRRPGWPEVAAQPPSAGRNGCWACAFTRGTALDRQAGRARLDLRVRVGRQAPDGPPSRVCVDAEGARSRWPAPPPGALGGGRPGRAGPQTARGARRVVPMPEKPWPASNGAGDGRRAHGGGAWRVRRSGGMRGGRHGGGRGDGARVSAGDPPARQRVDPPCRRPTPGARTRAGTLRGRWSGHDACLPFRRLTGAFGPWCPGGMWGWKVPSGRSFTLPNGLISRWSDGESAPANTRVPCAAWRLRPAAAGHRSRGNWNDGVGTPSGSPRCARRSALTHGPAPTTMPTGEQYPLARGRESAVVQAGAGKRRIHPKHRSARRAEPVVAR